MPGKRLRRPGSPWRLLVHEYLGQQPDGTTYGTSHHIANTAAWAGDSGEWRDAHLLEGTEFDELVVGKWATVHIEQIDTTRWWANFGGVVINIRVDRDGRPKHVHVFGPDDHAPSVDGVEYELTWSRENP